MLSQLSNNPAKRFPKMQRNRKNQNLLKALLITHFQFFFLWSLGCAVLLLQLALHSRMYSASSPVMVHAVEKVDIPYVRDTCLGLIDMRMSELKNNRKILDHRKKGKPRAAVTTCCLVVKAIR